MIASVKFKLKADTRRQCEKTIRYIISPHLNNSTARVIVSESMLRITVYKNKSSSTRMYSTGWITYCCAAPTNPLIINTQKSKSHIYIYKYIFLKHAWSLLEQKWSTIARGDQDTAEKQVQRFRENDLLQQLEEITALDYKWQGLKTFRAEFSPSFTKFKDLDGNHVPFQDYASKAAEYLEQVQWKAPDQDDNAES